jgi:hypothetical protein
MGETMRIETSDKTYLSIKDEYGNIINQPILVVAKTGGGKGLCMEQLAEDYHNNNCVIIAIADPKQNCELAFQMFKPQEEYHLNNLKAIGKPPREKKVKLYHPLITTIPSEYLPNYNFYTVPIKDLGDGEWSLLAETHSESDAVSILKRASAEISNEDGFYGFADKLKKIVKGSVKSGKKVADWDNLGFEGGSGTQKDLGRIGGFLKAFETFGFLTKKNFKYNIKWEEILNDQEHYHVFVTNFIDRTKYKKIIGFVILNLIQGIIRNKKLLKKHLVILIPELKNLVPFKAQGFEEFLADIFTQAISTVRSEGISVIADTQVIGDIDKRTRDVFKVTLLGELTGNDIDEVSKKFGITGREYKEFFRKPPKRNTFIIAESDSFQPYTFFMPSAMHKEPIPEKYNFERMYKEHSRKDPETYPMKKYSEMVKEIKEEYKKEKAKYMEKDRKQREQEELEELRKQEEKESKSGEKVKVEEKIEKAKEIQDKSKEMIMKLCYEAYQELKSYRKVAEKFRDMGVKTHVTAKKYVDDYAKKLEQENSKSYEDEFVENQP